MGVESYFAGMAEAKPMSGGQYFKGEGRFSLETKRMFVNNGHKGKFFIAEFEVKESTSPLDPVGATRSWSVPLEGERVKYSFGDIKNLIFALMGKNPSDVGAPNENPKLHQEATELVAAACDSEYAKKKGVGSEDLIGLPVDLETRFKATKPKPGQAVGGTFTIHTWSPTAE